MSTLNAYKNRDKDPTDIELSQVRYYNEMNSAIRKIRATKNIKDIDMSDVVTVIEFFAPSNLSPEVYNNNRIVFQGESIPLESFVNYIAKSNMLYKKDKRGKIYKTPNVQVTKQVLQ